MQIVRYGVSRAATAPYVTVRLEYRLNPNNKATEKTRILTLRCQHQAPQDIERSLRDAFDTQKVFPTALAEDLVDAICMLAISKRRGGQQRPLPNQAQKKTKEQQQPSSPDDDPPTVTTDIGSLYRDPENALRHADLQSVPEFVAQEYKNKMNEAFMANAIRPGDRAYKHDTRKNFNPTEKSEWDSD